MQKIYFESLGNPWGYPGLPREPMGIPEEPMGIPGEPTGIPGETMGIHSEKPFTRNNHPLGIAIGGASRSRGYLANLNNL